MSSIADLKKNAFQAASTTDGLAALGDEDFFFVRVIGRKCDGGDGVFRQSSPIENGECGAAEAFANDFLAVAGEKLERSGDGDEAGAVAVKAADMAVAAQEHFRNAMAAAGVVESGVAHDDGKGPRLQVGTAAGGHVVFGVHEGAVDFEEQGVPGEFRAEFGGDVFFEILHMALGAAHDIGLGGSVDERAQAADGGCGVVGLLGGDDFLAVVVGAFLEIAVADEDPGVFAEVGLGGGDDILPDIPEPFLVVVFAEGHGVTEFSLSVGGPQGDIGTAVEIGDDDGSDGLGFVFHSVRR